MISESVLTPGAARGARREQMLNDSDPEDAGGIPPRIAAPRSHPCLVDEASTGHAPPPPPVPTPVPLPPAPAVEAREGGTHGPGGGGSPGSRPSRAATAATAVAAAAAVAGALRARTAAALLAAAPAAAGVPRAPSRSPWIAPPSAGDGGSLIQGQGQGREVDGARAGGPPGEESDGVYVGTPAPRSGVGPSPQASDGNWMDTETLWSAVQRNGEELNRKRAGMPPARSGADIGISSRRVLQRIRTQLIVTARVAVKDPSTVAVPLFLLVCLLAFGLWGVFSVAYTIRDGRRDAALNAALNYGRTLESHIRATVAPASTVKTLIQLDPDWPSINATFSAVAGQLVEGGRQASAVLTIVLAPQGVVSAIVPPNLPGWDQVYGLDLLRNKSWRGDALKTVVLHGQGGEREMVMTGPSRLRAGMMGIVTRYAVFVEGAGPEETFGFNGSAYNCTACWLPGNATTAARRFWGFAQLNVDWDVLVTNVTRMYDMCSRDTLAFNMTYIDPVTRANRSIASCGGPLRDPVSVHLAIMNNAWHLAVCDARGWAPDWLPVVVAVVVLVSCWVAVAMAVILINRREHMWLLQAMLPDKVISALRRGEDYAEAFESVTVLFSDIVSYTTIASTMEPIKVVRLLNMMYSAFDALVDEHECYKVETIGDAFMAVCGTQGEDAPTAAARVARLAQAMIARTRVLESAEGQRLQIRIGLHSGPVVGAVVGFKMPHFCLCGDTVNTASRMESNSRPMCVHVSSTTARLLQESGIGFVLEPRGPVQIKGKGTMFTHWLLPEPGQRPMGQPAPQPTHGSHELVTHGSLPLDPDQERHSQRTQTGSQQQGRRRTLDAAADPDTSGLHRAPSGAMEHVVAAGGMGVSAEGQFLPLSLQLTPLQAGAGWVPRSQALSYRDGAPCSGDAGIVAVGLDMGPHSRGLHLTAPPSALLDVGTSPMTGTPTMAAAGGSGSLLMARGSGCGARKPRASVDLRLFQSNSHARTKNAL